MQYNKMRIFYFYPPKIFRKQKEKKKETAAFIETNVLFENKNNYTLNS